MISTLNNSFDKNKGLIFTELHWFKRTAQKYKTNCSAIRKRWISDLFVYEMWHLCDLLVQPIHFSIVVEWHIGTVSVLRLLHLYPQRWNLCFNWNIYFALNIIKLIKTMYDCIIFVVSFNKNWYTNYIGRSKTVLQ